MIVDGLRGVVDVRPAAVEIEEARARAERYGRSRTVLQESRDRARSRPGRRPGQLCANVELPAEAILARDQGAEGIGLYRTEFLYIDRASPPTEEEQYEIFRAVVEAMRPKPVTLRTFDIGGDKFVSTLPGAAGDEPDARPPRRAGSRSRPDVVPRSAARHGPRLRVRRRAKIVIPMVATLASSARCASCSTAPRLRSTPAGRRAPMRSRSA